MAWLTGWTYRKEITVSDESADYQTKVLVGESSGATGEEVDCGGHVAADFDDLRFTAADGSTLLDYWIESITGSSPNGLATVWVENNATPDTTLYMYYSGTETAVSSGADTFIVFDDFERGNDGDEIGGDWTESAGTVEISTGQAYGGTRSMKLVGANPSGKPTIPRVTSDAIAIRFRLYKEDTAYAYPALHGDGSDVCYWKIDASEDVSYYDTEWRDTGDNITADTWQLVELKNFVWASQTYDIVINDVLAQDNAGMYSNASYQDIVHIEGDPNAGRDSWIDDFIVRKWTATEPSFAFGAETTEGVLFIPRVTGIF